MLPSLSIDAVKGTKDGLSQSQMTKAGIRETRETREGVWLGRQVQHGMNGRWDEELVIMKREGGNSSAGAGGVW